MSSAKRMKAKKKMQSQPATIQAYSVWAVPSQVFQDTLNKFHLDAGLERKIAKLSVQDLTASAAEEKSIEEKKKAYQSELTNETLKFLVG